MLPFFCVCMCLCNCGYRLLFSLYVFAVVFFTQAYISKWNLFSGEYKLYGERERCWFLFGFFRIYVRTHTNTPITGCCCCVCQTVIFVLVVVHFFFLLFFRSFVILLPLFFIIILTIAINEISY